MPRGRRQAVLNHILKSPDHGLRFAIIENEFGEVGVDDKVLQEATDEEVIEVMNGCICCTVRGDLVQALKRLHAKIAKFDAVIIETTGLADPAPVAQTFFMDDEIEKMYRLDGICTVVDARHIMQHLDEEKPEGVENESVEQLAFADRILLNKVDLVEKDKSIKNTEAALRKIEARIRAINSAAPIFRCKQSNVNPNEVIGLDAFSLDRVLQMDPGFLDVDGEHQHDDSVSSCSYKRERELNHTLLNMFIERLVGDVEQAQNLFRYKGVLAVRGMKKKFVFQGVHMVFSGGFVDIEWKPGEKRECRFVFIGRNLDKAALIEGFEECKAEEKLRFQVGDEVQANMGQGSWSRGTVLKHWDQGNPYYIQLQDGDKVWTPIDDDRMIRSAKGASGKQVKPDKSSKSKRATPVKKTIAKKQTIASRGKSVKKSPKKGVAGRA